MLRPFSYLVVATFALAIGYYLAIFTQPLSHVVDTATTTPILTQLPLYTTQELKESTAAYNISAQYPVFGKPKIDAATAQAVHSIVEEFKSLPTNPDFAPPLELTISYETPYVGSEVISFGLTISEYTGGAHPNSYTRGLNFDTITGRQLVLDDALSLIGLTLKQVSVAATAQLRERLGDSFFVEGAGPNEKNFESFVVTADSVTFVFQSYQVGPYAAGPQEMSFGRTK